MIPTNRDSFIQFCRRKLGEPTIKVNTSPEQDDDRVDEALSLFHARHYNATEEVWILYTITDADNTSGYILLEKDIVFVTDIMLPTASAGLFSVEYQLQLESLFSPSMIGANSLSYYYMVKRNVALINRLFSPMRQYTYNPITNKLIISGGTKNTDQMAGGIIIKAYKKIYGEVDDIPVGDTTNNLVENIWSDRWLQNYTTELMRKQWGQNLSKFQTVQLLGGVTLDGAGMLAMAEENINKLEEQLYNTYEEPPMFLIG